MGAMGVIVPMVKSADEARRVVSATRYTPQGTRRWGSSASEHVFDAVDCFERSNDNMLAALIVETKETLDDLEAQAAVPGVDVLTLGPWDMSLALGPRKLPPPEMDSVLDRALEVGRQTGVAVGHSADTPHELRELQARGVTFLGCGSDYELLAQSARSVLAAFERNDERPGTLGGDWYTAITENTDACVLHAMRSRAHRTQHCS